MVISSVLEDFKVKLHLFEALARISRLLRKCRRVRRPLDADQKAWIEAAILVEPFPICLIRLGLVYIRVD